MKLLLILVAVSFVVSDIEVNPIANEWKKFKEHYNKTYKNEDEENLRLGIFTKTYTGVQNHNEKFTAGKVSYSIGINQFSDLKTDEVNQMYNGLTVHPDFDTETFQSYQVGSNLTLPDSIDWTTLGAVSPVGDQKTCRCSWAFSAAEAMEGQHFIKKKQFVALSVQNIIDCSKIKGSDGCNGGFMIDAYKYVIKNKGINRDVDYPYESNVGKCRFLPNKIGAKFTGFANLPMFDEDKLKAAVATHGPVAVAIDASSSDFHSYKSGVFDYPECSAMSLNRAVLVVGYGTVHGRDYWLVKNSFGAEWGDHGYIKMARNKKNQCGIATVGSYPVV